MKKYILLIIISSYSMIQAVVIDKVNISKGNIIAYSHGTRHAIKGQEYGKAMAKALKEKPHARWRSFNIGSETYTMSHPTAQWVCNGLNVC